MLILTCSLYVPAPTRSVSTGEATATACPIVAQGCVGMVQSFTPSLPAGSTYRVAAAHAAGTPSEPEASTFPVTVSHPAFPGPAAHPHQFMVALCSAGVSSSIPTVLPRTLLFWAVIVGTKL